MLRISSRTVRGNPLRRARGARATCRMHLQATRTGVIFISEILNHSARAARLWWRQAARPYGRLRAEH